MKYGKLNLGQVEAIINKLGGEEGVQRLLSGQSEVVRKRHLIDCDADPFTPEGWSVEEHQRGGQEVEWDPKRIQFYFSPSQQQGDIIRGSELRDELKGQSVLNANVLDYLLRHPFLIPEEWKKDEQGNTCYVYFWGTTYRDSDGNICARSLYWNGSSWGWPCHWLSRGWDARGPAAVLASDLNP